MSWPAFWAPFWRRLRNPSGTTTAHMPPCAWTPPPTAGLPWPRLLQAFTAGLVLWHRQISTEGPLTASAIAEAVPRVIGSLSAEYDPTRP